MGEKILELIEKSKLELPKAKNVNKGYMVFATRLANLLLEAASERAEVASYLATVKGWKQYEENQLQVTNTQENTKLAEPKDSDGKVEIEDNFLYPLPLLLAGTLGRI